jgi:hypothetical protein
VYKPTIGDNDRPVKPEDVRSTILLLYGAAIEALLLFGGIAWVIVLTTR